MEHPDRRLSSAEFAKAIQYLPGGVNSPARSWKSVGGTPITLRRGQGSRVWDIDGNEYIDYLASWGPLILGHSHHRVLAEVETALRNGTSFGAPTELETRLARDVVEAYHSIDMVRFVNSGTEAAMSALRLARAFTGRHKVVKFAGGYHGHADALLVKAGSGAAAMGVPDSAGITPSYAQDTLVARFNDIASVEALFDAHPQEIACVIVEPVAGNMGVVPPDPAFLPGLRELTSAHGVLLIFDEVITGFRVAYGGAQERYGITPDITCLGKIIGGGMPVGAYGGRSGVMEMVSPLGPMYQAGTLSGNPVAMAAGISTLEQLRHPGTYEELERKGIELEGALAEAFHRVEIPVRVNRVGSMLTVFFTDQEVRDWESVSRCDSEGYARIFHELLERGVYFPPSPFEAAFISLAHTTADLETTRQALFDAAASSRPA